MKNQSLPDTRCTNSSNQSITFARYNLSPTVTAPVFLSTFAAKITRCYHQLATPTERGGSNSRRIIDSNLAVHSSPFHLQQLCSATTLLLLLAVPRKQASSTWHICRLPLEGEGINKSSSSSSSSIPQSFHLNGTCTSRGRERERARIPPTLRRWRQCSGTSAKCHPATS